MFDTPDTSYSDSDTTDTTVSAPPVAISLVVSPEATEVLSGLYSSERAFPCSGRTELFFAPPGERRVRREKREATALAYCNQCSAKEMCKLAGRAGREHGMWGGENDE